MGGDIDPQRDSNAKQDESPENENLAANSGPGNPDKNSCKTISNTTSKESAQSSYKEFA